MNRLIFDIGAHVGTDSEFYLAKGFDVVAVEADPGHSGTLRRRFAEQIRQGRFTLWEASIGDYDGECDFLIHKKNSEWHRRNFDLTRFAPEEFDTVRVTSLTFDFIKNRYPLPYYIKVDIEGADGYVIKCVSDDYRPPFISFEVGADCEECLRHLHSAGYANFQVVDQSYNFCTIPPYPPREGNFVRVQFNGQMSGLFGRELRGDWLEYEVAVRSVQELNHEKGWFDVHAALSLF